jgi:hypothetical protein
MYPERCSLYFQKCDMIPARQQAEHNLSGLWGWSNPTPYTLNPKT